MDSRELRTDATESKQERDNGLQEYDTDTMILILLGVEEAGQGPSEIRY
jgi:hypothetical protein